MFWWKSRKTRRTAARSESGNRWRLRPQLEMLEDRCVPSGTVTITAIQGPDTLSAAVPVATEGALASPSLNAAFTDTNAVNPANLTVTVNYGDGTPISSNRTGPNFDTNLFITQVGGAGGTTYTVTDSHTFPEESGSTVPPFAFTLTLRVTENANAADTDSQTTTAQVLDASLSPGNPITPGPGTVTTGGNAGNPVSAGQALANFEATIGGPRNTAPSPQPNGFRTITWDGVKVDGTDSVAGPNSTTVITPGHTVGIPLNRFQGSGVYFGAIYAVSNDGFLDVNPSVAGLFPAFSSPNTFAMFNDNGIDFKFVAPSPTGTAPVPAASRGFGAVFLNVQQPGSTTITYFNGNTVLDTLNVPTNASPGSQVFAGERFTQPIVTNVLLTLGNGVIFKFDGTTVSAGGTNGVGIGVDGQPTNLVAVDDWAFDEPMPIANGPPPVAATAGNPFTGVVATFSDLDPNGNARDYTATINWGDGHLTNGSIQANGQGGFNVIGTNTYAQAGTFPINVDIADFGGGPGVGGSQPTLSVNNTANVRPLTLSNVAITDGASNSNQTQRSEVREIALTFSSPVSLGTTTVSLSLLNTGGSGKNDGSAPTDVSVALGTPMSSGGGTTWMIPIVKSTAFSDATGSLSDGIYTLTIDPTKVTGGTLTGINLSTTFHRLFGDITGGKTVNNGDYLKFKQSYLTSTGYPKFNADFDYDANGTINNADFLQFKKRYLTTLTY